MAYTLFVAGWIATEYWYTVGSFSWPWLILGNGFSHDVRLVQWYEYTGVFGGSLWVLVANLLIFEAWMHRSARRWAAAALAVAGPMVLSGIIYLSYRQPSERCTITALQPNVDCYDKFAGDDASQERNLLELMSESPAGVRFILAPETALTRYMDEAALDRYPHLRPFVDTLNARYPDALFISGANTLRFYAPGARTETARFDGRIWYDHFNTAIALSGDGVQGLYHKGRLVIGVENTPTWVFRALKFLVIDLGGVMGQIGIGQNRTVFEAGGIRIGPAICYEGLYGDFFGDFVRRGAEVMAIISNDGWWGDTPGYRHLFSISRLRAVEHRRAVARSANTGRSGFIDCRGDVVGPSLGWDVRGAVTCELPPESRADLLHPLGRLPRPAGPVCHGALPALLCGLAGQAEKPPRGIEKLSTRYELHPNSRLPLHGAHLVPGEGASAYKPGLERISAFCRHLGNPQRNFFTIHVAGTNGKGSVSHILASVLQQAGYRTGLYTSPHLTDFRERIKVDGEMIPKQKVVNFVDKHREKMEELELSFFEMSTALAFDYFAQSDVEVAVIETGLGGRLDATNIVVPLLSVITNIGMDHTALLGDTPRRSPVRRPASSRRASPS